MYLYIYIYISNIKHPILKYTYKGSPPTPPHGRAARRGAGGGLVWRGRDPSKVCSHVRYRMLHTNLFIFSHIYVYIYICICRERDIYVNMYIYRYLRRTSPYVYLGDQGCPVLSSFDRMKARDLRMYLHSHLCLIWGPCYWNWDNQNYS